MAPKEKISLRASAGLPSSCSGDMYCMVPRIVPCTVSGRLMVGEAPGSPCKISSSFAKPKSSSFAPVFVSITFAGFNSRCQRLALEIFHHQILGAVLMADVVEHADVRMAEAGNGARLTLKSLANFRRGR